MTKRSNRFVRLLLDERGAYPLEYAGVTAVALVLAAVLIGGIQSNRFEIGGAMAGVIDHIIESWGGGGGGTIDYDLDVDPGRPHANSRP